MSNNPRNVPRIMRQADARSLGEQIAAHKVDCTRCGHAPRPLPCGAMATMRAELASIRDELANWFSPPDDAETLF